MYPRMVLNYWPVITQMLGWQACGSKHTFIHSSVSGQLNRIHLLPNVNTAAMNIGVQNLQGSTPGNHVPRSRSHPLVWEHLLLLSSTPASPTLPSSVPRDSSHTLHILFSPFTFKCGQVDESEVMSRHDFDWHFPNDEWHNLVNVYQPLLCTVW